MWIISESELILGQQFENVVPAKSTGILAMINIYIKKIKNPAALTGRGRDASRRLLIHAHFAAKWGAGWRQMNTATINSGALVFCLHYAFTCTEGLS